MFVYDWVDNHTYSYDFVCFVLLVVCRFLIWMQSLQSLGSASYVRGMRVQVDELFCACVVRDAAVVVMVVMLCSASLILFTLNFFGAGAASCFVRPSCSSS